MASADVLLVLAQLLQLPDAFGAKQTIRAIAQAAGLDVTSFTLGEPTERWIEIAAQAMDAWGAVTTQAVRALFLRLGTDPGDIADDGQPDQSADQTPRPGFLSAFGAGWYGTIRGGVTFAQGFETVTNSTGKSVNFKPGDLIFERNYAAANGGSPTYTNAPSPSQYVNVDGSLTLANGQSVTIPIIANQPGSYGSASSGSINILNTQSFGALTVTNASGLTGVDREKRADYINRCLLAPDSNAPGGPTKAYLRAMNTAQDGTVLINYLSGLPVAITAGQILPNSATGTVTGYLAGPSGAISATDLSSAMANIIGLPLGLITSPVGVLPDTVGLLPTATDPGTGSPGFASATNQPIAFTYTARIPASKVPGGATPGTYTSSGSPPATVAAVFTTIGSALNAYLPALGPGALDQVAGAGVVYTADTQDTIRDSLAGLYGVAMTLPAGATTAVPLGNVPTQGTTLGTLIVTAG